MKESLGIEACMPTGISMGVSWGEGEMMQVNPNLKKVIGEIFSEGHPYRGLILNG